MISLAVRQEELVRHRSPWVFLAIVEVESFRGRRHSSAAEWRTIVRQGFGRGWRHSSAAEWGTTVRQSFFQRLDLSVGGHGVRCDFRSSPPGVSKYIYSRDHLSIWS